MKQRRTHNSAQAQLFPETQKEWETKGVFSEHYIRTKLKASSLWPKEDDVKPLWVFCKNLWESLYITLAKGDEELTKQELLEPILTKLGFAYSRGKRLPVGRKEPDYLLFADEATKQKILAEPMGIQYTTAISVMEAKKVNHPLDAVSRRETPGRFPHQQIRDYLQEAADQSGIPYFRWAILTNGNKWRLYCRDAHPTHYFEFNFEMAVSSLEKFIVFSTLFSPKAFIKDNEGRCPLDDLRNEALQYQTALEDDLRKRVFVILTRLANGFFKRSENKICKEELKELYENCLIFLYRLLFVLYAEGRGLLPVKPVGAGSNKNYRERYSLQRLVSKLRNTQNFASDDFYDLYEEILKLFHLINGDQPTMNKKCDVPLYNGRLFDSKKFPLLDRWQLGENTLAEVLRGLMFANIPEGKGEQREFDFGETIDYADLEVRQLGSIYEGLLENHLEFESNCLILKGDKAERKATGTYYTPDHIVRYIAENTLNPLCEEIEKSTEVQKSLKEKVKDNSFAKAVLRLRVLDPAMGSGHFLVRATEFLADKILNHPTTILQQVDKVLKGLSQEQAEIAYWRRRVVESCIYGVDFNQLAVELAKLSLWLTCIATDQPLSFLDHHLRPGNSIIGAKLRELGELKNNRKPKSNIQMGTFFEVDISKILSDAIHAIKEIIATESKNISIIKDKEVHWQKEVRELLKPYRDVANLWTSSFFGNKIDSTTYQELSHLMVLNPKTHDVELKKLKKLIEPYTEFQNIAEKNMFFHWELEFPEVFFNEEGAIQKNPGFDAIIGNPPYGFRDVLPPEMKIIFRKGFNIDFPSGDVAEIFVKKANDLIRKNGYISFIIPKKSAYGDAWNQIRLLWSSNKLVSIADVSKTFVEVLLEQIVFVMTKKEPQKDNLLVSTFVSEKTDIKKIGEVLIKSKSREPIYIYASEKMSTIFNKILKNCIQISKLNFNIRIGQSNITSFMKDTPPDDPVKVVKGIDIYRYGIKGHRYIDKKHADMTYMKPKVIVQEIIAHITRPEPHIQIMAYNDSEGLLVHDTVVGIFQDKFNRDFLTAIFNSKFISWFAYNIIYCRAIRTMHFIDFYVSQLPIPRISFEITKEKGKKLLKEAIALYENKDYSTLLNFVDKRLKSKSPESDVVHDLLAFLAEQMNEMNKDNRKIVNEFLSWLENEFIKGSIEKLKNKTKIENFYDYPVQSIVDVLKSNNQLPKFLRPDDLRYKMLTTAFQKTMSKLTPLNQRLKMTDDLIDQIVYKLYGITENEIKIIEGENIN